MIQMTGRTSPGDVGPTILHPKIRVIARRPLAAPRALSLAAIQAGLANGQYVLTEGVIRPGPVVGNHTWLTLVDRNNATLIIIPGALSRSALALLGAHVLVRGISAVRRDDAERPIGHELFVQSVDDVRAQPSKWQGLFGSAVVSISAIRDSNVADRFATYHVRGRVLRKELDGFVIADASGSVEVRAAEAPAVTRGSIVEVIGLPQLEHAAVSLDHAQFWVLDSVFSPFRTSQSLSEAQALRSGQDDEPLQMPGRVISDVRSGRDDGIFIADGRKQFELAVAAPRQVGLPLPRARVHCRGFRYVAPHPPL